MRWVRLGALPAFIVLYATMYAAFGAASPFWPRFFETRGLTPAQLGLLLGLGTLVRLVAGPLVGRIADMTGALRIALASCAACAAAIALVLLTTKEFGLLVLIHIAQAAVLAPTTTLADALAVNAAMRAPANRFEYGWVRGAASAAFIAGTLVAGQIVSATDLSPIVWMHAGLLACAVLATALVPGLALKSPPAAKDSAARAHPGKADCAGPSHSGATASAASEEGTASAAPGAVAARRGGTTTAIKRMQARCRSAKVKPCSGCTSASTAMAAVCDITIQRIVPATAAIAAAPLGPKRWIRLGPIQKNTTTSAATEADHNRLIGSEPMPAAFQRMTAKVSCIAWLPEINAATRTVRRNSAIPKSLRTPPNAERTTPRRSVEPVGCDVAGQSPSRPFNARHGNWRNV